MYCPHCGVNNDRGESECYICGKPLPAITVPVAEPERRGGGRKSSAVASSTAAIATVGDRTLALLFDRALIVGAMSLFAASETSSTGHFGRSMSSLFGGIAGYAVIVFVYHSLLEGLIGTTLGKSMMSLQVQSTGERGRFVAALLRNLLRLVDSLFFYLVGFLAAMFTARRQRVGDIAGGTVVMETRSRNALRAAMMVLWLIVVAGVFWTAESSCPTCTFDTGLLRRAGLIG